MLPLTDRKSHPRTHSTTATYISSIFNKTDREDMNIAAGEEKTLWDDLTADYVTNTKRAKILTSTLMQER